MKTAHLLLAAALLGLSGPASAALDLRRAEVTHLPNGLTVILLEDHSRPLVSIQSLYKSGSAAETTGKTGLAHFLEHLVFRGSQNFPKGRATDLIYDAGGEWHGYTAMDQTTYFATMPSNQLDLLLRIDADRMARTVIDPASIEAEKGAVITELHSYENDPTSVLQEAVTRTAIQSHPYGSPMAGYVSDVVGLTADDARTYYASHYAPGNAVLTIAGDFVPSEAKALAARDFADVPARAVATPHPTAELPQHGERRTRLTGVVDRQYFQLAYPAPAASSPDFPAYLVLQEILSGGSGVNLRQSDWSSTPSIKGSLLFGAADDIATWLPPTHDPFLFTISGSIAEEANSDALERDVALRVARLRNAPISQTTLANAKATVTTAIASDVQTTEDAAHQLAFFEGIGAFDVLLDLPIRVATVSGADIQRIARTYLVPDKLTVGWMVPGKAPGGQIGIGIPRPAADRAGTPLSTSPVGPPQLRRLSGGLTAIVQPNPLSNTTTVELLLSAPSESGTHPEELPGLDAVVRSGTADGLASLINVVSATSRKPQAAKPQSDDPVTRLEQLIVAQTGHHSGNPTPLAVIVSGNVDPSRAFAMLEQALGHVAPVSIGVPAVRAALPGLTTIRERIAKPLAQGGIGYVVQAPSPGTREAAAWQMLLYVLTHDYSGRLGHSAITDKGIVYYIGSALRTDGASSWTTISIGVDPDKSDAMEVELRAQLARLVTEPPTTSELEAARTHLLGRDVTAAQTNEEFTAKLAREFVETNGLRTHEQLVGQLQSITSADLVAAVPAFIQGKILRVDVGNTP